MPENEQATLEFVVKKYIAQIEAYIEAKKGYRNYSDSANTGTASLMESMRLFTEKSLQFNNFELTGEKVEAARKFLILINEALPKLINLDKTKQLEQVFNVMGLLGVHITELHFVREKYQNKPAGSYDAIISEFNNALIVLRFEIEKSIAMDKITKNNELLFTSEAKQASAPQPPIQESAVDFVHSDVDVHLGINNNTVVSHTAKNPYEPDF